MATVRQLDKRNVVLGVINGALFQLSSTFVDSGIVLAPLVLMLMGPSTLWQGLMVSAMGVGWAWPQARCCWWPSNSTCSAAGSRPFSFRPPATGRPAPG